MLDTTLAILHALRSATEPLRTLRLAPTGLTPTWVPLWPFRRSQNHVRALAEAIWANREFLVGVKGISR
jgi:hypothetical protein